MNKNKFYITTTIPYVNAPPHIGHALEFVQADAIARTRRAAGDEVYFLSGADENAIKNVQAAEKAGVPVDEFIARNSDVFETLLSALRVSNGDFIRTTEERHKRGAQALWAATNPDDIYKKAYRGLYCAGCELFYEPEELDDQGECFEHPGKKLEIIEEENYFFKLSRYGDWLRDIIERGELSIIPDIRKNEMLAFISRGLKDFSISRPVSRSKRWGVPVPGDEHHTMYVWYDALANYITALGYPDTEARLYKTFWAENPNRFHILGKGVARFHAIYWPAMLKSAGLPVPTREFVHGYVTVNGQKISKSLGNVVDPFALIDAYGVDAVRFYLLHEISAHGDGDFSEARFKESYNAHLANGLGNFAARVLALAAKVTVKHPDEVTPLIEAEIAQARERVARAMERFAFHEAMEAIWGLISFGDTYVNERKPWETNDVAVIADLVVVLDNLGVLLAPFLPTTAEKITKSLSWSENVLHVQKGAVLFPRISS